MFILQRIRSVTVWAPGALDAEPKKYRSLLRIWIPAFNALAILCGINAARYGSQMLDKIFGHDADILGLLFAAVAFVCMAGVVFPRLALVEVVGKCGLLGMLIGYMFCLILYPSDAQLEFSQNPNWFIVTMISLGFPLACFRLNMLADEEFARRVSKRAKELRDAESE